jgi:DNA segregation ATPase FtsK/SpoIIIE, S-DNA-T family
MARRKTYRRRSATTRRRTPSRVASYKSSVRRRKKASIKLKVKKQIAREIWAVILLLIAAVTVLSIQGAFGLVGEIWVKMLRPIIGWGIYVIPVLFAAAAMMMFVSKKISFNASRVFGMFLFLVSVLGVFHMAVPLDQILTYAQAGSHGGYIGFVTNFVFRQILMVGNIGTGIVFIGIFLVSILLTFESSLRTVVRAITPKVTIEIDRSKDSKERVQRSIEEVDRSVLGRIFSRKGEAEEVEPDLMIRRPIDPNGPSAAAMAEEAQEIDMDINVEGEAEADEAAKKKIAEQLAAEEERKEETAEDVLIAEKQKVAEVLEWEFPSLDLLSSDRATIHADDKFLKANAENIRNKLSQFGIEVVMQEVNVGPTVVQYTLKPADGVKLSKITTLKSDLALALAAKSIRLEAPIPGKSLVGIEVPNDKRANVRLREILESDEFEKVDSKLRLPLGRDVAGKPVVADLETMPHLLIAGSTGSGKSVCMNAFLMALLYQNTPEELKMIMVDPKRVELGAYNHIPYLLAPVIKEADKAALSLRWVVAEMTRRYQVLSDIRVRNIKEYNASSKATEKMPRIIVVIDELADLMMAAGKEVEASICRIAQMARAVGIHLIIATQRPSVDVITGLIKANIPARVAFAVSSQVDSRTILDGAGAEDLLGRGDMLYLPSGMGKPFRIQGVFVSTKETERVANKIKLTVEPEYDESITSTEIAQRKLSGIPDSKLGGNAGGADGGSVGDAMYQQAYDLVRETRKASASLLQRRLKVGYARAARLIDILEEKGVVGPANGAKPREILMKEEG